MKFFRELPFPSLSSAQNILLLSHTMVSCLPKSWVHLRAWDWTPLPSYLAKGKSCSPFCSNVRMSEKARRLDVLYMLPGIPYQFVIFVSICFICISVFHWILRDTSWYFATGLSSLQWLISLIQWKQSFHINVIEARRRSCLQTKRKHYRGLSLCWEYVRCNLKKIFRNPCKERGNSWHPAVGSSIPFAHLV